MDGGVGAYDDDATGWTIPGPRSIVEAEASQLSDDGESDSDIMRSAGNLDSEGAGSARGPTHRPEYELAQGKIRLAQVEPFRPIAQDDARQPP
jgi:hypothetical protein